MFAISERLSEYAYGFGATAEALAYLRSTGVQAVPFLPNLVHENEVAFDVSFSAPGTMLMLQFKLGHQLKRFVRKPSSQDIPGVERPFWRFEVNVDEQQYIRLRSWETMGADVYYVAPRFADWRTYQRHFLHESILDSSLLLTPSDIQIGAGGAPGKHRIVYDKQAQFVCSETRRATERQARKELVNVALRSESAVPLEVTLDRLRTGENAAPALGQIRRADLPARDALAQRIRSKARTPIEGEAAVFAAEAWAEGVQVMFVGSSLTESRLETV